VCSEFFNVFSGIGGLAVCAVFLFGTLGSFEGCGSEEGLGENGLG